MTSSRVTHHCAKPCCGFDDGVKTTWSVPPRAALSTSSEPNARNALGQHSDAGPHPPRRGLLVGRRLRTFGHRGRPATPHSLTKTRTGEVTTRLGSAVIAGTAAPIAPLAGNPPPPAPARGLGRLRTARSAVLH